MDSGQGGFRSYLGPAFVAVLMKPYLDPIPDFDVFVSIS